MQCTATKKDTIIIFLSCLVIFLIAPSPELVAFQARFALFAQEMLRHGISLFPITYLGPYPDYPAAPTILIYWASLLFGKVTPLTAIFPTALISAITLTTLYRIGALHSRDWGIAGTLFALFTQFFIMEARSICPDLATTCITTVCFYLVYSSDLIPHPLERRQGPAPTIFLWLILLLFVAGFAFRGPIGLVIPTGVVCSYYLCTKNFKRFFLFGFVGLMLLILCGTALLAAAYKTGGHGFVKQVIEMQAFGRLGYHENGFAFYWLISFLVYAISYPLAVAVIFSRTKSILKMENKNFKLLAYLAAWALVVLIGMSIPGAKKVRYVLPMIPAIALIAGYLFVDPAPRGFLALTKKILTGFCRIFPFLMLILLLTAWIFKKDMIPFSGPTVSVICLLTIASGFAYKKRFNPLVTLAIGALTLITINIGVVQPAIYQAEKTKPFVSQFESLQAQKPGETIFFQTGPDAEDIKFVVNLDKPITPRFMQSPEQIFKQKKFAYFVAENNDFEKLPPSMKKKLKIRLEGKIGHRKFVIFVLTFIPT